MALVEDKGGILLKGKNKKERASEAYTELFHHGQIYIKLKRV